MASPSFRSPLDEKKPLWVEKRTRTRDKAKSEEPVEDQSANQPSGEQIQILKGVEPSGRDQFLGKPI